MDAPARASGDQRRKRGQAPLPPGAPPCHGHLGGPSAGWRRSSSMETKRLFAPLARKYSVLSKRLKIPASAVRQACFEPVETGGPGVRPVRASACGAAPMAQWHWALYISVGSKMLLASPRTAQGLTCFYGLVNSLRKPFRSDLNLPKQAFPFVLQRKKLAGDVQGGQNCCCQGRRRRGRRQHLAQTVVQVAGNPPDLGLSPVRAQDIFAA